jgi:tetratricopeptide (TPR) repeat protein
VENAGQLLGITCTVVPFPCVWRNEHTVQTRIAERRKRKVYLWGSDRQENKMNASLHSLDRAFDELYNTLPEILGEAFIEEKGPKGSLPLLQQSQKKLTNELGIEISTLRQRCRNGLQCILQQLESMTEPEIIIAIPRLKDELCSTFDSLLSPPTFTQIVLRVVSGETWREALRLPRDTLDLLYTGARAVFEDGRFQEAINCFAFLSWFDARQYDFWMALGHSQFHCALHDNAISSYGVAAICLPEESWPHIYSATCYEALGDFEQASRCLQQGLGLEKNKAASDRGLAHTIERKIEQYRQGTVNPIS